MKICLKTLVREGGDKQVVIDIHKRLPSYIIADCHFACHIKASYCDGYYLLEISSQGILQIECQRCLQPFPYNFEHKSVLAACTDEVAAENLLGEYETIVANNHFIDLNDIITDDIYLTAPEKHINSQDCDDEIQLYFRSQNG